MQLEEFVRTTGLVSKTEVEKATYLAYFHLRKSSLTDFTKADIERWFESQHLGTPNSSRLAGKLVAQGVCVKAAGSKISLHARTISRLEVELPFLSDHSEEIVSRGSILPIALTANTRGYVDRLASQINASYEQNIFDGCAVLMRRLLEVLLIHTYSHHHIESAIQIAQDQYKDLKQIIADAISNRTLALSKSTKDILDEFRVLGNFSVHKLIYNCRKEEIKKVSREYRAAIEELLYKSGIKQ